MVAIALSLFLAFADDRAVVADYLGDAAAQLSNGNATGFLKRFDRDMPGYSKLETELASLVKVAAVSSAVQVLDMKAEGDGWLLSVDWFLELRMHGQELSSERRRELVQLRLKRVGKTWKILSLEPQTLFNAPRL